MSANLSFIKRDGQTDNAGLKVRNEATHRSDRVRLLLDVFSLLRIKAESSSWAGSLRPPPCSGDTGLPCSARPPTAAFPPLPRTLLSLPSHPHPALAAQHPVHLPHSSQLRTMPLLGEDSHLFARSGSRTCMFSDRHDFSSIALLAFHDRL